MIINGHIPAQPSTTLVRARIRAWYRRDAARRIAEACTFARAARAQLPAR